MPGPPTQILIMSYAQSIAMLALFLSLRFFKLVVPMPSAPGKPCGSILPHPASSVQTTQSCATPCCEPLWQSDAACGDSRHRQRVTAGSPGMC
jgi:hypothetical protein